jgi:hypothetical protein
MTMLPMNVVRLHQELSLPPPAERGCAVWWQAGLALGWPKYKREGLLQ